MSGRSILVWAAAVALVAAGCTIGGGDEVVTVLVSGDPAELRAYRDVAAAFERGDPGIDVRLIEVAERDDLILRLSTSIAAADPPDVFLLNYRYYGQFAANGSLEPVEPYLADSAALSADDFYPEAMEPFRFGGVQTCLPQNVSSLVVYYNRDLFDAAEVPEPADGWTWRQMVARATELTRDEDGDGAVDTYGLGVDPEIIRVAPFVWSNGGELVNDDDRPRRFTLDDRPASEALQLFLDLRALHGVVPTDEEAESRDLESRFLDGGLAMLMESRRVTPTLRTITDFAWDVAPIPMLARPAGILHSDAYCMTADSEHHDAAWRYLEFALGPEGQRIAAETGRTVPSLIDVANSDAFLEPSRAPASSEVFLDVIPVLRAVPHVSTWAEIEDATNALLEEAFYGEGSATEVVTQIERVTEPLFARAEG